ncbi:hypothetical protein KSS87_017462 [Heliosperma pusillum]|nr:hypothetical protein KSS87_017462 [Heliosperma pusillum]
MLNIAPCTSQNSPSIFSSTMDIPSSSSSSTFMAGSRALDRHNPIITDEKRSGVSSNPESSRYLLDDTSFLDVLSGFDPVLKLNPDNDTKSSNGNNVEVSNEFDASSKPTKNSSSSSPSLDQVVVLRVSLHCRGCERKMKKHLSRMSGVTSFSIDFAAKKVTVIGDVTPLQVLASISKVKTAKLWSPTIPSSSHINARIVEPIN